MSKVKKKWIDLDYSSNQSLKAENIPYSIDLSIKDAIDNIDTDNVMYKELVELENEDVMNKYIELDKTPRLETNVSLFIINGGPQEYGVDYYVELEPTPVLKWDGMDLEDYLEVGDKLKILYPFKLV